MKKSKQTVLSSQENLKNNCYLFTCSLCGLIVILQALVTIIHILSVRSLGKQLKPSYPRESAWDYSSGQAK